MTLPGIFSQRDPRWSGIRLGLSSDTIGQEGCLVTAIANMLWYMGHETTPEQVNTWLLQNDGYVDGDLVVWGKVPAISSDIHAVGSTSNVADLNSFLAIPSNWAIVQLRKPGFSMHFSVAVSPNEIADSWDGVQKALDSYTFVTAHLYGDNTPAVTVVAQPVSSPRVIAPAQFTAWGPGNVRVLVDTLHVHNAPTVLSAGNVATGTPDGMLHQGNLFLVNGYVDTQTVTQNGKSSPRWLHTSQGHYVWAADTDFPVQWTPPQEAAPAATPQPVAPQTTAPAQPAQDGVKEPQSAPSEPTITAQAVSVADTPDQATTDSMVQLFVDEKGRPAPRFIQTLKNAPLIDIHSGAQVVGKNLLPLYIPSDDIFAVYQIRREAGNLYYQNQQMASRTPSVGVRLLDAKEVQDPRLSALEAIAELGFWSRLGAATVHAINGEGFFYWLFPKVTKQKGGDTT